MAVLHRSRLKKRAFALSLGLALGLVPGAALAATQAKLVHCGQETCLRLSGHRAHTQVAVRVAGHTLAVEGDRAWHATVPLATARDWASASGSVMMLTLTDGQAGGERQEAVTLPPGALGRRVELATLMVSAH
jgi:hypothetical protein